MFSLAKTILGGLGLLITAGGGLITNGVIDTSKETNIWQLLELVKKVRDIDDYLNRDNFNNKEELGWYQRHETIRKNICRKWQREGVFKAEEVIGLCEWGKT